jgi:hypothetical protein
VPRRHTKDGSTERSAVAASTIERGTEQARRLLREATLHGAVVSSPQSITQATAIRCTGDFVIGHRVRAPRWIWGDYVAPHAR